jgi:tetratricopeptide (TPR) repeat protein
MIRRLYRGSEPFGQGAQLDPRPIEERVASAEEGAEIGERLRSAEIIRGSRQALGILYGIAGRYREMVELAERDVADIRSTDSRLEQSDTIRKLATVRIAVEGAFEEGLALGERAKAAGGEGPPHQQMHALGPILVALFQLGRWDELDAAVEEHMVAFRLDPATECQAVRDGPAIGATALALRGRSDAAAGLASLLGDPLSDPSASAWQARYATASGQPALARAIAENRAFERRTYGPQHAFALLEALSALGDLEAAGAFLQEARREVAGNAMLAPLVDRVDGEIRLAAGDRDSAAAMFGAAVTGFGALKSVLEEARAVEWLAAALSGPEADRARARAVTVYARLGMRWSG